MTNPNSKLTKDANIISLTTKNSWNAKIVEGWFLVESLYGWETLKVLKKMVAIEFKMGLPSSLVKLKKVNFKKSVVRTGF